MHKKLLSILLCFSMIFPSLLAVSAPVSAETWTLSGNGSGWKAVYPSNNQNDYLQDQQTGSGSVSQDIVGDDTYPSTYMRFTDDELAIRIRVSNANGNGSYEFKNFAFVGVDADLNGSVDFFLGAYNPTGNNGRLGIYGSNGAYANTGPSTTGISGKPILSFKPVQDVNYAIAPTGDGSRFNGDDDYFVSFKFSVADISAALAQKGMTFNASTPFRFMTGTAAQDNAFNQDLNGMDKSGWSSKKTWNALGVFSNVTSAAGSVVYHTVKFDNNTGDTEASPDFKTVVSGSGPLGTLPSAPTKRGMYFLGWNTQPDGKGTAVNAGTAINGDLTAYAVWSDKKTYTVTFNPNFNGAGAAVTTATKDGIVGDLMPAAPTQNNRYFTGWNTASNGSGTWFNALTPVSQNTTVYAQWASQANKAALFYNNFTPDGGTLVATVYSNGNSSNFNGGFPDVVRPGYMFKGWYLNDKSGSGTAATGINQEGSYYAKWTVATPAITFVANAGTDAVTGMPASRTASGGRFGTMPASEPVRAGYRFIEWNRSADGLGEAIYPSTSIAGDTSVYAIWKSSKNVAFDPNGGDGATQTIAAVEGKLSFLPQPPSREGYSFRGWAASPSAEQEADLQNVTGYSVLYAAWTPVYEVTFDVNQGNWAAGAQTLDILTAYGSVLYLPDVPERDRYTFGGWNTKADGSGDPFTASTEVSQKGTRAYAVWTPVPSAKYKVDFETNGGTSVAQLETDAILKQPVSTKNGYVFEGWYLDSKLGPEQKAEFPYSVTADTTLYAKWTAEEVSVTLNDNGGYGGSGSISVALDQAMPTASAPLREGHKFEGYFDQPSGGAAYYDSAMAGTRNWDKIGNGSVLYAQWTPVELIVDFNANGGQYADTGGQASVNQTYGSTYRLPSTPAREGFKFASWNRQADGQGEVVTANSTVTSTVYHTVYATWTELGNATFTYASNNTKYGSVSIGSESLNPETGIPAGATAIPNPGYRFQEWQGAGGEQVGTSETYVPSKGGTGGGTGYVDGAYTAVFVPSVFSVTLDDNEGSGGSGSVKAEYDQPMPQAIKPLRPGYTFAGYYDQKTEGTLYYDAEMNSARNWNKIDDSSVLYAHWTAAEISAVFYANGGSYAGGSEEATIEQTYGGAYKLPSQEPVREGYAFSSWNTRQDGQGETITAATPVTLESALSIYAVWTENDKVVIRYAVNETDYGTVSRTEESLNPTTGKALGSTAESNPGYRFVEWQNGKGTPVSTEPTWIPEKVSGSYVKDTFTAVFRAAAIKVVLDDNGGSGGSGSVKATYNKPMPNASTPTREGYRFSGYADQRSGGTPYYNAGMNSVRDWDKTADNVVLYAQWTQNEITGTVIDDESPGRAVAKAKIRIVKGSKPYGEETLTDSSGKFTIYNIPAGTYNLIMTIGEKTEIVAIKVKANEPVTELGKIIFPLSSASSALTLKTPKTPPVVIDNLHPEAEQYLLEENNQGFVKVEMSVSDVEENTTDADLKQSVEKIKAQEHEKNAYIGLYLDITLDKYKRNTEQESWGTPTGKLKETKGLIEIMIPIPASLQGQTSSLYRVYRDHGSEPTHTIQETPNAQGEYLKLDPDGQTLTLYVKKFSVYALAYLVPAAYSVEHYVMNADGSYPASPNRTSSGSGLADSTLTVSDLQDNALSGSGVAYGYGTVNGATTRTASVKGDGSLVVKLYYARRSQTPAGSPSPAAPAANSGAPAPSPAVQYDVTFDGAGGVPASATRSVADGSLLIRPTDPVKEGQRFGGWSRADGSKWNFAADRVHAALILKAEWIALDRGPQAPVLDKVNHFAYMQGYPDGTFRADRNMTRAEVVAMFSRLLTEKMNMDQSYASEFRDVASANWYADAVGYMKRHGVVTGYADGTFGPEDPITRAEFAAIAARFDKLAADEDSTFRDVKPSYWAAAAIASGVSKGWIKGYPDGTFRPEDYVTRAEAVTLVNRMTERRADRSYIDQPSGMLRSYSDLKKAYWAYYDIMEAVTRHEYVKGSNEESWTAF